MKTAERQQRLRERLEEMGQIERRLYQEGASAVAGVDEVGRGPLAGPVVAACVILPPDFDLLGVDDSKKLSEKRRLQLAPEIRKRALAFGIGMASEQVVDRINILEATKGAMKTAIAAAAEKLKRQREMELSHVLIDAVRLSGIPYKQQSIVKGDSRSISIAAASILAKVTRDSMMIRYEEEFPGYDFAANKGYGTGAHYRGLEKLGPCRIHRQSFLKKFYDKRR